MRAERVSRPPDCFPVRVTPGELTSGFILVLLTAILFLAPSGRTYAQTTSRSFQMGMWVYPVTAIPPSTDYDIRTFSQGEDQPPGRSIMLFGWDKPASPGNYDWSRILAVEIDEPYTVAGVDSLDVCELDPSALDSINQVEQKLAARAAELKAFAPLTRFWVNFTPQHVNWMEGTTCTNPDGSGFIISVPLNKPYIDVISLDDYWIPFNQVQPYYDWFVAHQATPQQQLILIPGTFYRSGRDNPGTVASYLQGYFDYANSMNQTCNLPLGDRGVTGSSDGCPVWMVVGFVSGNYSDSKNNYVGELDPSSAPIAAAWRQEVAVPVRRDLANQRTRGQILQTVLPLLLQY